MHTVTLVVLILHDSFRHPTNTHSRYVLVAHAGSHNSRPALQYTCTSIHGEGSRIQNKKLSYREEHSASVVLSWCTVLYDISREKIC